MSIHDYDTTRLERVLPRPVPPVLSQEARTARTSLIVVCSAALVGYIFWVEVAWPILLALMVVQVMVR